MEYPEEDERLDVFPTGHLNNGNYGSPENRYHDDDEDVNYNDYDGDEGNDNDYNDDEDGIMNNGDNPSPSPSSPPPPSSSDEDADSLDDDDENEDLDAFLSSIETKLRNSFTALDLAKTISSQGHYLTALPSAIVATTVGGSSAGGAAGGTTKGSTRPCRCIRLIGKVFDRMAKPIKLRVLISLLGLEPNVGSKHLEQTLTTNSMSHTYNNENNDDDDHHHDMEKERRERKKLKHDVKTNTAIWDLLTQAAEDDDDEWVRVVGGVVRGKMFHTATTERDDANDDHDDKASSTANDEHDEKSLAKTTTAIASTAVLHPSSSSSSCRGKEAENLLRKTCDSILKNVQTHANDAAVALEEAEAELDEEYENDNDEDAEIDEDDQNADKYGEEIKKQKEAERDAALDSYLLTDDVAPLFIPIFYTFLSPTMIRHVLPGETYATSSVLNGDDDDDNNPHFNINTQAEILTVDADAEKKKVEEEIKEMEHKLKLKKLAEEKAKRNGNVTAASSGGGMRSISGGRFGGGAGAGTGGRLGAGASRTNLHGGRGGAAMAMKGDDDLSNIKRRGAAAPPSLFMRSRTSKGRGSGAPTAPGGRGATMGRGSGVATPGMRPLSTPLQRKTPLHARTPGAARALLSSGRRPGGLSAAGRGSGPGGGGPAAAASASTSATTSTLGGGGRAMKTHAKSKMKMIDVAEVEGLTKEHKERDDKIAAEMTIEQRKEARKRKLLEEAAAKGLRSNKKWGAPGAAGKAGESHATAAGPDSNRPKVTPAGNRVAQMANAAIDDASPQQEAAASTSPVPAVSAVTGMAQAAAGANVAGSNNAVPNPLSATIPLGGDNTNRQSVASAAIDGSGMINLASTGALGAKAAEAVSFYQQMTDGTPAQRPQVPTSQQAMPTSGYSGAYPHAGGLNATVATAPTLYGAQQMMSSAAPNAVAVAGQPTPVGTEGGSSSSALPPPSAAQHNWQQLLEKSNKISTEDRFRIEQFFTARYNPTPEVPVYKMKLNEEKTLDPQTGMTVKETLYLELDYNTFGFKKLRKVKKK